MNNNFKILCFVIVFSITGSSGFASALVFLKRNPSYTIERLNTVLKFGRSAESIGVGLVNALNEAVSQSLFSQNRINQRALSISFASSGGPINPLRNPHQIVLEKIHVKGNRVSFDITLHTDKMIGIATIGVNRGLSKAGIAFFRQYQGRKVVIEA